MVNKPQQGCLARNAISLLVAAFISPCSALHKCFITNKPASLDTSKAVSEIQLASESIRINCTDSNTFITVSPKSRFESIDNNQCIAYTSKNINIHNKHIYATANNGEIRFASKDNQSLQFKIESGSINYLLQSASNEPDCFADDTNDRIAKAFVGIFVVTTVSGIMFWGLWELLDGSGAYIN